MVVSGEGKGQDFRIVADESLKMLRRGWYLGGESFGEKLLSLLDRATSAKRRKGSLGGSAARAHDQAEAERLAKAGLEWPGLPVRPGELSGRGKWLEEKSVLATLIRRRTGVPNGLGGGAPRDGRRGECDRGLAAGEGVAGSGKATA